ncbi:MAG: hypothetical protein ACRDNJ_07315 [Solirubrobacteraceae bacterium]
MAVTATHSEQLLELNEDVRDAWSAYVYRLRSLSGDEYVDAEAEAWSELQYELHRIQCARDELTAAGSAHQRPES